MNDSEIYVDIAVKAAKEAGKIHKKYFGVIIS